MGGPATRLPLPVVAVTGTAGKTTVAATLDALLRAAGRRTVAWLDHGVAIEGEPQIGELAPWGRGVQMVLRGELAIGVQELSAEMVQTVGLPLGAYLGAVITSIALNDPVYGPTEIAMRQQRAAQAVAAAVHPDGFLVLNADDRAVADLGSATASRTILCALRRNSPLLARHLREGGSGLYLSDHEIIWEDDGRLTPLGRVDTLPFTLNGLAPFQSANLLLALGAALSCGLTPDQLRPLLAALSAYPRLAERIITLESGAHCRLIVARADNPPALAAVARLARRVAAGGGRLIGSVLWTPYQRLPDPSGIARTLARIYDVVYLHGDDRATGAALVGAAPSASGPTLAVPARGETDAIRRLLRRSVSGDRLLILTGDVAAATALVDSYALVERGAEAAGRDSERSSTR